MLPLAMAAPDPINLSRLSALQAEVAAAEIERMLHAIDLDRTSGEEGERIAAAFLDRKLAEYGIAHTTYEARLLGLVDDAHPTAAQLLDAVMGDLLSNQRVATGLAVLALH